MKADYIENQNPYEYESVRSQPTKTRQESSRVRNMRDDENSEQISIISHTTSNMWTLVSYMSAKMCMK